MIYNISNTNSQNFNGSFLVRFNKEFPELKEIFEKGINSNFNKSYQKNCEQLPKRFFKFENPLGKKDYTLYVMKHSSDLGAAQFLDKNKNSLVGLQYFPTVNMSEIISPKIKVDNYFADNNPLCIKSIKKVMEYINKTFENRITLIENTIKNKNKKKNILNINDIAQKFNIDIISKEQNYKGKKGCLRVIGSQASEMIISPATQYGNRYIFVKPKTGHGETKYILLTSNNEYREYNSKDIKAVRKFFDDFNSAIKSNM